MQQLSHIRLMSSLSKQPAGISWALCGQTTRSASRIPPEDTECSVLVKLGILFLPLLSIPFPEWRLCPLQTTERSDELPGKRRALTLKHKSFSSLCTSHPRSVGIPISLRNIVNMSACQINCDTFVIVRSSSALRSNPCFPSRSENAEFSRIIALFQTMFFPPSFRRGGSEGAVSKVIREINCCWDVCSHFWQFPIESTFSKPKRRFCWRNVSLSFITFK